MPIDADRLTRRLSRATGALSALAAACLLAIVVLISAGVVMRYLLGQPILGLNEIVQLAAVALVMAALPHATLREDHVAVDVFDRALGRLGRLFGDVLARVISAVVLAILCQRAVLKGLDAWEWGDATNMLRMPIWPFYAILALGSGLCVVVFAVQLVTIFSRGRRE